MLNDRFPISPAGYKKLEEELHHLRTVERPSIILAIAEARAHGDLSENAEYHAAKEKQSFIEAKISDDESKISRAQIIDPSKVVSKIVQFGATIVVQDEDTYEFMTYKIVSEYEADASKGDISISSPVARAFIGKKVNESVEVNTPKGTKYYIIISLKYV